MLHFSGLGLLVPLFFVGGIWGTGYVIDELIVHQTGYYVAHDWTKFAGMVVAGTLCHVFGRLLDKRTGRIMIDPKTGKEELIGGHHSFFFIPMHWWGLILPVSGALLWIYDSWFL